MARPVKPVIYGESARRILPTDYDPDLLGTTLSQILGVDLTAGRAATFPPVLPNFVPPQGIPSRVAASVLPRVPVVAQPAPLPGKEPATVASAYQSGSAYPNAPQFDTSAPPSAYEQVGPPPTRKEPVRGDYRDVMTIMALLPLLGGEFGARLVPQVANAGVQGVMARNQMMYEDEIKKYEQAFRTAEGVRRGAVEARDFSNELKQQEFENLMSIAKDRRISENVREDNQRAASQVELQRQKEARNLLEGIRRIKDPVQQEAAWKSAMDLYGPGYLAGINVGPVYDDQTGEYIPIYDVRVVEQMLKAETAEERNKIAREGIKSREKIASEAAKAKVTAREDTQTHQRQMQEDRQTFAREQQKRAQNHTEEMKKLSNSAKSKYESGSITKKAMELAQRMQSIAGRKQAYVSSFVGDLLGRTADPARIKQFDNEIDTTLQLLQVELGTTGMKWDGNRQTMKGQIKAKSGAGIRGTTNMSGVPSLPPPGFNTNNPPASKKPTSQMTMEELLSEYNKAIGGAR